MRTVPKSPEPLPPDSGGAEDAVADERAAVENALVRSLLDEIDCGVLACLPDARVLWANHAARRELNSGGPLFLVDGALHARDEQLGAALQSAAAGKRQLRKVGHPDELMVSLLPLQAAAAGRRHALVAVVLGRRFAIGDLSLQMLASLHALSHAERLVLAGLVRGQSPTDMARERRIAISTVRTQIATVRRKCSVDSIGDLLRLVARMPPITSALRCC